MKKPIEFKNKHVISNPFFRVRNLVAYERILTFVRNDKAVVTLVNKYIVFGLFLFLISCNFLEEPSQEEVAQLYVDILIAEETHKSDIDSMKVVLDSLYKFHQINEKDYLSELEKNSYDKETWKVFFNFAEEYLDTLKAVEKREVKLK